MFGQNGGFTGLPKERVSPAQRQDLLDEEEILTRPRSAFAAIRHGGRGRNAEHMRLCLQLRKSGLQRPDLKVVLLEAMHEVCFRQRHLALSDRGRQPSQ